MHSLKMGNRPFSDWYQEWSTHTSRSKANEETKMYAFRQNIPAPLHGKILGVHPAPTTMTRLVNLAKDFDQTWHMYNTRSSRSSSNYTCNPNVRAANPDEPDDPSISLANFPPRDPNPRSKKLTQEEKAKRRREGCCMYCGKKGHWQDKCPNKPSRPSNRFPPRNQPPCTRATEVSEPRPESPKLKEEPTISRLWTIPEQDFNTSHPDPDYTNTGDF